MGAVLSPKNVAAATDQIIFAGKTAVLVSPQLAGERMELNRLADVIGQDFPAAARSAIVRATFKIRS